MSMLTNNQDMLDFINSKIMKPSKLQFNKVYQFFIKIIIKSLLSSIEKLESTEYSLICCDIVFNIFWTLLNYTRNIKLTMFLCDRSIDLFNEYMEMILAALNNNILSENKIKIKTTDIKLFIYNKTIGSIVFNKRTSQKSSFKNKFLLTKNACMVMQIYVRTIFIIYNNSKNLYTSEDFDYSINEESIAEEILENIYDRLSNLVYVLYNNNLGNLVETLINNEIDLLQYNLDDSEMITKSINKIHLKLYVLSNYVKKNKKRDILDNITEFNQKTNIECENIFFKKRNFETNKMVKKIVREFNKLNNS